ncbi:MAG: hypothetical protein FD163_2099 [Hyphomonadaceae bacterium]|nr:MAG: hypothetical protein FD128_685 [Hyphomonadaceae bacterium]KAF0183905.1 MAG: hypothetical protein FD163_2099 [Hyphomonadaceae bacterium]
MKRIIGLLCTLGFASAVLAQPALNNANIPSEKVSAKIRSSTKTASVQIREGFQTGAALSSFRVSFLNGDHWVRHLQIGQRETAQCNSAEFALFDRNSDDPFYAEASWYQSPSFKATNHTALGGGDFEINLTTDMASDYVPVIKGFSFQRRNLNDAQVRAIGVRVSPDGSKVRVTLVDDEGALERGWETTIGERFAVSASPKGNLVAQNISQFDAMARIASQEVVNGKRQFFVNVQIAWIPKSMVMGRSTVSGTNASILSGRSPLATNKSVISGFLFHYLDAQHHLMEMGISPNVDGGSMAVSFQDTDLEDPIQWYVDFVSVQ